MRVAILCPVVYSAVVQETMFGPMIGGFYDGRLMYLGFGTSTSPMFQIIAEYAEPPMLLPAERRERRHFEQIVRYIETNRNRPHLKMHAIGTPFQEAVWTQLLKIPYGKTWTYRQLAAACGMPGASRAVASACAANPISVLIPCHRVIHTSGQIGGYHW